MRVRRPTWGAFLMVVLAPGAVAQATGAWTWDADGSGTLTVGDIYLSGASAGSTARPDDASLGALLGPATLAPRVVDVDGTGSPSPGDAAYHDANGNGIVDAGDVRWSGPGFGQVVKASDADARAEYLASSTPLALYAPGNGVPPEAYLWTAPIVAPGTFRMASIGGLPAGSQARPGDADFNRSLAPLLGRPGVVQPPATLLLRVDPALPAAGGNATVAVMAAGRPVAGANVTLAREGVVTATRATNAAGLATFSGLLAGRHVVTAASAGFAPATQAFDVAARGPDLRLVRLDVPDTADVDAAILARVTVTNTGDARGTSTVTLLADGVPRISRDVTLDAGQTATFLLPGISFPSAGDHDVAVRLDGPSLEGQSATVRVSSALPGWLLPLLVLGGLAVLGGGALGVRALLRRAPELDAADGPPDGPCPPGAQRRFRTRVEMDPQDVDLSLVKIVSLTLAVPGRDGEASEADDETLEALNGALWGRRLGDPDSAVRDALREAALDVARSARELTRRRGAPSDVTLVARIEASAAPFEVKLCRCEGEGDAARWVTKVSQAMTAKDARDLRLEPLRGVAPDAGEDALARDVAARLADLIRRTPLLVAGGVRVEKDEEGPTLG